MSLVFIVSSLWFCMHMCMYSGHGYATLDMTPNLSDGKDSFSDPELYSTLKNVSPKYVSNTFNIYV